MAGRGSRWKTCSTLCSLELDRLRRQKKEKARGKRRLIEQREQQKRRKVGRICGWCRKPIPMDRRVYAKYCSYECQQAMHYQRFLDNPEARRRQKEYLKKWHEKTRPRQTRSERPCAICGSIVGIDRLPHVRYCSIICRRAGQLLSTKKLQANEKYKTWARQYARARRQELHADPDWRDWQKELGARSRARVSAPIKAMQELGWLDGYEILSEPKTEPKIKMQYQPRLKHTTRFVKGHFRNYKHLGRVWVEPKKIRVLNARWSRNCLPQMQCKIIVVDSSGTARVKYNGKRNSRPEKSWHRPSDEKRKLLLSVLRELGWIKNGKLAMMT